MAEINEMLQEDRDGRISRREFIQKGAILTGSLAAATSLVDSLAPSISWGAQVDPNDPALNSTAVTYPSTDGTPIKAYLTRPKKAGKLPAVVVIHQNRGLDDHIRDVARRLAKAGYAALAPDLMSRLGGTDSFPNSDAVIAAIKKVDEEMITKDLIGAIDYLKGQNFVRPNKIGVVGFCWGGGNVLLIATRDKDLAAAVVYYGRNPKNLDDVRNITAPVLGHYGEKDEAITSGAPKLAAAMKKYGKSFEYKVYPGAPHAFNDDTNRDRYRPEAAKEAWGRTLQFFKEHLQS